MAQRLIAFGWFGGKNSHLNFLLPNLPTDNKIYVEPFGGSAAVLLNRQDKNAVYNDLNGELVNFFKVLRNQSEELLRVLTLTPVSKEEHRLSLIPLSTDNEVERARKFYVSVLQSYGNIYGDGTWGPRGLGSAKSVQRWLNKIDKGLPLVVERLRNVGTEHLNALECIRRYDSLGTLFYLDPPYIVNNDRLTRDDYRVAYSIGDLDNLSRLLHKARGRAAISGYHGFMDDIFPKWRCVEDIMKRSPVPTGGKAMRQEVLWCNYDEKGMKI